MPPSPSHNQLAPLWPHWSCPMMSSTVGFSMSPSTFTNHRYLQVHPWEYLFLWITVCRYLALKKPADPGVKGESAQVICSTCALEPVQPDPSGTGTPCLSDTYNIA